MQRLFQNPSDIQYPVPFPDPVSEQERKEQANIHARELNQRIFTLKDLTRRTTTVFTNFEQDRTIGTLTNLLDSKKSLREAITQVDDLRYKLVPFYDPHGNLLENAITAKNLAEELLTKINETSLLPPLPSRSSIFSRSKK